MISTLQSSWSTFASDAPLVVAASIATLVLQLFVRRIWEHFFETGKLKIVPLKCVAHIIRWQEYDLSPGYREKLLASPDPIDQWRVRCAEEAIGRVRAYEVDMDFDIRNVGKRHVGVNGIQIDDWIVLDQDFDLRRARSAGYAPRMDYRVKHRESGKPQSLHATCYLAAGDALPLTLSILVAASRPLTEFQRKYMSVLPEPSEFHILAYDDRGRLHACTMKTHPVDAGTELRARLESYASGELKLGDERPNDVLEDAKALVYMDLLRGRDRRLRSRIKRWWRYSGRHRWMRRLRGATWRLQRILHRP